jgi:outer membrane receptor protein involved in Fe transport
LRAVVFAAALPLLAQHVTSDALGTVSDPSGAVLVGAEVTVVNVETGQAHTTATSETGQYHVFGLDPGTYRVSAAHDGFQTAIRQGLELFVDQKLVVDFTLPVGKRQETVEVNARASLLETTDAGMSGVVTGSALRDLPLNGRDLFQLAMLQPGVLPVEAGGNPFAEGGLTRAAVQGSRPSMNNSTLDGADMNDPANNIPPGGVAGLQLGVEAVREFRVLLNSYSAEFGRNAGANVQYITRSGTNEFHGSAFEFFRNAALDARNFFDIGSVPHFVRNQFGGSAGGPLRRNRAFFFANIENLLETKSITQSLSVPDANAHQGKLPLAAAPGTLVSIGVAPQIAPFLNLYPFPNAGSLGGGLGLLRVSERQPARENYGLMRADFSLNQRHQLFARYNIDDSASTVPFASTAMPGFPSDRAIRNQYAMAGWQWTPRPDRLNDLRINLTRIHQLSEPSFSNPLSISLTAGRALGAVAIAGLPQLGASVTSPIESGSNTWELIDNVSHQRGSHTLRAGIDFKRLNLNGWFDALKNGEYAFTDLSPFGFPTYSNNPPLEAFLEGLPFVYLGVDPALADSDRGYRQNYFGAYLQDDWKVKPHFTLNLGLRWEYTSTPSEVNGRISNILNLATDTHPTPGRLWSSVPLNLWSPRLGFAWTPSSRSNTVIRGGAGLMRDQIWGALYSDARFYEPYYRILEYILPTFLNKPPSVASVVGLGGPPSVIGLYGITYHPSFPYVLEYNLNIQHEVAHDWLVQAAYAGSRGNHLPRSGEANPFDPFVGHRLNPALGSTQVIVTDGQSFYNSLQGRVEKRMARGLTFQANYTFSKSVDDSSGPFPTDYINEAGVSQSLPDRKGDRGRSAFDHTHALVANALYAIPEGRNILLKGWDLGSVVSMISGPPFSAVLGFNNSGTQSSVPADRPNLNAEAHPCSANTGSPNEWFDPSIFNLPAPGAYGNAGRNILCGPPLKNVDFSLTKQTKLGERANLQFRAEFFNLFNHANFNVPVNTQGGSGAGGNGDAVFVGSRGASCVPGAAPYACGILAPNVGQITSTSTPSRQIQLGLKLIF